MKTGLDFERKFIEVITEMVILSGMNHTDFAKKTFGETDGSVVKWRRMRNAFSATGRPQRLTVGEAWRMAEVLGKTYPELCFTVEQRLKAEK
ncbi:hypothetical protein [Desulfobaculum bizertense]|uniref:Uncharacterized protein n=1 Tax=Desulfobaculum bizertense DSM 18034 TaxID=1121442 RepID=A0A1T4W6C1_9BACT|nr:hypothetical protein [Desulfobaculum bizertense]SKA72679.1 hypothetical protein SAMN02745702_01659 [Desulfobaculum bizertense DSM 18034]